MHYATASCIGRESWATSNLLILQRLHCATLPQRGFSIFMRFCLFHRLLVVLFLASAIGMMARAADRAKAIAHWDFGTEEATPLIAHGGVHRDQPGPRPPTFPDFDTTNTAIKLDGSGAHFSYADPGPNSPFDFTNGDAITIEAWVNVEDLRNGENSYIIGKGRTHAPGFARDNQNWALRVREGEGLAHISFLFATKADAKSAGSKADAHWHRWTSTAGFAPGSGWHHIATSYKFGDNKSIRGWIDGKPVIGIWDMGGESNEAPVVDDDAVWIGSSMGGSASNSFRGWLDDIAVFREITNDATMATRYRREGPEPIVGPAPETMPELGPLPAGRVSFSFHEGLATHDRWPRGTETVPAAVAQWTSETFLLPRLPLRYDDWGIREGWKAPVLARLAAEIKLPPGQMRFLIRARGLSRLWINGQLIAGTKAHGGSSDGHEKVEPLPEPPLPGARPAGFGDREALGEATVPADGKCRLVFESIVGGKKLRAEPGELCVAVQAPDGKAFHLVQASGEAVPLTDAAMKPALLRVEKALVAFDDQTRRQEAISQREFWEKRHLFASGWLRANPAPPVPKNAPHPVDAFLLQKIERVRAASAEDKSLFHSDVLPLLRDNCFRCHGEKEKGGLRLNSREASLKAGASGKVAITPGDVTKSEVIARIRSTDEGQRMPPTGHGLSAKQISTLENWVKSGAPWPAPPVAPEQIALPPQVDDAAFLRRVYFDTVGVPPEADEVRAFLADKTTDKRTKLVDRLLQDERWADHWVSYWQDVLAENPNMLKPSLNNSGPFRWYLYEALRDNRPLDRMVTELVMLRGSEREGGSAGFGLAADNDAPLAAKGQILAGAFLGVELQCARCHDSPYHSTKQRDLYALAAMMNRKPTTVPKTSTVPAGFFEKKARESLIKVTLKPGEPVEPQWPFRESMPIADDATLNSLLQNPTDTRERLAGLITTPQNTRFAQVAVNRIWKRYMGAGLVEKADDWEGHAPSHPKLLDWLAKEFVAHGYDMKHIARLILTSQAYGRAATGHNIEAAPEQRFFNAPDKRRLTAEQVLDSLYTASGHHLEVEELTFDPDSRRPADTMISLGYPQRAWMFSTLSNERDRPSLSLPRAQAVVDVLEAFGWNGSRQNARTDRESAPNVLQPGVLANSLVSTWVTRASGGSELARLALEARAPADLVDTLFLRFLGRFPSAEEKVPLIKALSDGFATRRVPDSEIKDAAPETRLGRVSWSNHLAPEANSIKLEMERRARNGAPPDSRLQPVWRETYEDCVWSLINTREFVWMP